VKQFGLRGIAGFAVHLLQDFTTTDGVPWLPSPRLIAIALRKCGLRGAVAASCVSVNLAGAITVVGTALIVLEVGGVAYAIYGKVREKRARTSSRRRDGGLRRGSRVESQRLAAASRAACHTQGDAVFFLSATPKQYEATTSPASQKRKGATRKREHERSHAAREACPV
jgi:hypothetical protein